MRSAQNPIAYPECHPLTAGQVRGSWAPYPQVPKGRHRTHRCETCGYLIHSPGLTPNCKHTWFNQRTTERRGGEAAELLPRRSYPAGRFGSPGGSDLAVTANWRHTATRGLPLGSLTSEFLYYASCSSEGWLYTFHTQAEVLARKRTSSDTNKDDTPKPFEPRC